MAAITTKSFSCQDESRTPDKTRVEVVALGAAKAARFTLQPGWATSSTSPRWRSTTGETCATAAAEEAAAAINHSGRPDLGAGFIPGAGGTVTLEPGVAAAALYNDCEPATVSWALERLGPQPLVTPQQAPTAIAWHSQPSTYVVCADDQAIHPDLQRLLAKRCTHAVEWTTGHSPFLSTPAAVAQLLRTLARGQGE